MAQGPDRQLAVDTDHSPLLSPGSAGTSPSGAVTEPRSAGERRTGVISSPVRRQSVTFPAELERHSPQAHTAASFPATPQGRGPHGRDEATEAGAYAHPLLSKTPGQLWWQATRQRGVAYIAVASVLAGLTVAATYAPTGVAITLFTLAAAGSWVVAAALFSDLLAAVAKRCWCVRWLVNVMVDARKEPLMLVPLFTIAAALVAAAYFQEGYAEEWRSCVGGAGAAVCIVWLVSFAVSCSTDSTRVDDPYAGLITLASAAAFCASWYLPERNQEVRGFGLGLWLALRFTAWIDYRDFRLAPFQPSHGAISARELRHAAKYCYAAYDQAYPRHRGSADADVDAAPLQRTAPYCSHWTHTLLRDGYELRAVLGSVWMGFPQCFGTLYVRGAKAPPSAPGHFAAPWDIVVALTGTQSAADVWADLDAALVRHALSGGAVHRGMMGYFLTAWAGAPWRGLDGLETCIVRCVREWRTARGCAPRILITGHSLGGASATLAVGQLAARCRASELEHSHSAGLWFGVEFDLLTFGAPHVGDATFVEWMKDMAPNAVHVVQSTDPIPRSVSNPPPHGKMPPLASATAGASSCWHGGDAYVMALYHHHRHAGSPADGSTPRSRRRRRAERGGSDAALLRDFFFAAALRCMWAVPQFITSALRYIVFGGPVAAVPPAEPPSYGALGRAERQADLAGIVGSSGLPEPARASDSTASDASSSRTESPAV
eukprot:TRINITY_DN55367_c0_g1_i1.p1 TRINITY_DN55367_c0_g1~~TRINITY_DN55367_c0_g1_i1.p1  ORF type:complete len:717 (+),score=154.90 TRINITY_DN55367_c0_g1_i1:81-2231(+)